MPSTTTKHNIPYPLSSERVADFPATARQLAERVDTLLTGLDTRLNTAEGNIRTALTASNVGAVKFVEKISKSVYITSFSTEAVTEAKFAKAFTHDNFFVIPMVYGNTPVSISFLRASTPRAGVKFKTVSSISSSANLTVELFVFEITGR